MLSWARRSELAKLQPPQESQAELCSNTSRTPMAPLRCSTCGTPDSKRFTKRCYAPSKPTALRPSRCVGALATWDVLPSSTAALRRTSITDTKKPAANGQISLGKPAWHISDACGVSEIHGGKHACINEPSDSGRLDRGLACSCHPCAGARQRHHRLGR